jgi:hypothetical protein
MCSARRASAGSEDRRQLTIDDFNEIAWRDFVMWAWSEPQMRKQFTKATGLKIEASTTPIEAAIDAVTGARKSVMTQFVEWATREHWGLEHAPVAYREMLAKAQRP